MRYKHRSIEEKGSKVPAYIVTFSDMTTLLLTFFVMLLSLTHFQDEELFHIGRDSFSWSIRSLGLGMFFGRMPRPDFGNVKVRYFIGSPDKLFKGRTIHAKEEQIRQAFNNLRRTVRTMPSQIVAQKTNFLVTNIRFSRENERLDESAKRFLSDFCLHLQQDSGSSPIKLYVLGLAGDGATEKEQWILSAKRARAVVDFIQDVLPPIAKWPVYSWGAGPGGDWVGQDSPISKKSQILIAVMRASD